MIQNKVLSAYFWSVTQEKQKTPNKITLNFRLTPQIKMFLS